MTIEKTFAGAKGVSARFRKNIPVFGRKNPGVRQMNKWAPALIYVLAMGLAVFMAGAENRGIVLALEIVFSVPIGPVLIPKITIGG